MKPCAGVSVRYYLAPYCTAALMPLDQCVHSKCENEFRRFRVKQAKKGTPCKLLRALDVLMEIQKVESRSSSAMPPFW